MRFALIRISIKIVLCVCVWGILFYFEVPQIIRVSLVAGMAGFIAIPYRKYF